MPIYEYRCDDCSHGFETIQRVGARPLRKCPECSGRLRKLVSRASFQLKGGGWFAEQYSRKPGGKSTETAKPAADTSVAAKAKKAD